MQAAEQRRLHPARNVMAALVVFQRYSLDLQFTGQQTELHIFRRTGMHSQPLFDLSLHIALRHVQNNESRALRLPIYNAFSFLSSESRILLC